MKAATGALLAIFLCCLAGSAQVNDICSDFGLRPSLDSPWANVPYVYGTIRFTGQGGDSRLPKITVTLVDPQQTQRITIEKSGKYCFKRNSGGGGTLIIEVDGVETARRSLSSLSPAQQREDFDIHSSQPDRAGPPTTVSARFFHPPNDRTSELYKKAAEAERRKDTKQAVEYLKKIVQIDPADFIAWAYLGSFLLEQNSLADAEAALRKSITLKLEYPTPWINVARIRIAQKQFEAAIEILKHAVTLDRTSAKSFQLLGETYLQARQGTLGAQALNQALKLDPIGMAECHLQLAHLYQLAGAKSMAAREYKLFLEKVTDHPDKKKFERYIQDNPEL